MTLYFTVSLELIYGITAIFLFKWTNNSFKSLIEKSGLAASCIRILLGLYFFKYFNAIKEESDLSLPPFIILTELWVFFFLKWLILLVTIKIFLKSFELTDFSIEW